MVTDSVPLKPDDLINYDMLQQLQDGFAAVTGMCLVLCRRDGKVLTKPSLGNALCSLLCENDHKRAEPFVAEAVEAAKQLSLYDTAPRTFSRGAMELYAAPVVVRGMRLATMVACRNPCPLLVGKSADQIAETTGIDLDQVKQAMSKSVTLGGAQLKAAIEHLHSITTTLAYAWEQQHKLRMRIKEAAILHSLISMFAGKASLDEILEAAAQQAIEATAATACSIRVIDQQSGELTIRAVANLSAEYLQKGPVKVADSPVDQEALKGQCVYIENMATDPRVLYKQQAKDEGLASGLAVGMVYRDKPVGVVHLYTDTPHRFDEFELSHLQAIASQICLAIVNTYLRDEAIRAEQMDRQMKLAGQVQRRMIPKTAPSVQGLDIGTVYRPSFSVGGDFYDFAVLSGDRLGFAIADVAGKGIPASLQMASLRAALRAHTLEYHEVVDVIDLAAKAFRRDTLPGEFATVFMGTIDPAKNVISYVNAGHNPPVIVRDHTLEMLKVSGPIIGVFDKHTYKSFEVALAPGETLVMYTDGATDAMNFDHHRFGDDRLLEAIRKYAEMPAQQMADSILWDIRRFAGLATQSDDITIVVLKHT